MADLLYDIKHVFTGYLKGEEKYNIPEYQRGYKWSTQQITELLDDINDFETNGDNELFYCLQNVTLVQDQYDANKINVVDGQQRLTTISLLLTFLGETKRIADKLIYSVRQPSNEFLQLLINDEDVRRRLSETESFDDFISDFEDVDYDYQDIYFMFNAYRKIEQWFKDNEDVTKVTFLEKLLNQVKLIVNRVENVSEQELFMNLNAGQVHLDGSDLVRAILITRVAKQEMIEYDSENVEDIVRLNERRLRIGWELDELNSWWSQPTIREYFSNFSNIKTAPQETIQFDEKLYPINLLYKLWVEANGKTDIRLGWFEEKSTSALDLYTDIIRAHRVLVDWYNDRYLYHLLGFLFCNNGAKFKTLWKIWNSKDYTRERFKEHLRKLARRTVFGGKPSDDNIETGLEFWLFRMTNFNTKSPTNWYDSDKLERILILLDVIEHSQNREAGNPLPFLKPRYFNNYKEDKEHIYPGTPKQLDVLKELENPITSVNTYIDKLNEGYEGDALIENWDISKEDWLELEDQEKELRRLALKEEIHKLRPINSIGNLVLLHRSINRGFGNDYYNAKRTMVVKNALNGEYVRHHTLNVFVKNVDSDDLNEWTMDDINSNAQAIYDKLFDFFEVEFKKETDEE